MYILKNAWRSISRAKVRNILIGVIVLVIATSSCVALSIREASGTAKEQYLEEMEVTAQISVDRQSMMQGFSKDSEGGFDKESMKDMLANQESLTLEELKTYARADSVKDFYYTGTTTVNTDDNWEAVDTTGITEETEDDKSGFSSMGGGRGGQMSGQKPGRMGMQGDATIVGYSSDSAMTGFVAGTSTITDGQMFEENTQAYDCVISDELATYNELQVGDTIAVVNPNNEGESYTLTIVGLYNNQESGMSKTGMMGGFSTATDSANQIYMSYDALSLILEASEATAEAAKQEDDETEVSALVNQLSGTYTFATVEDYETFEEEARAFGLSDDYTISSGDLTSYEQSLQPLNNLSEYAMYFFIVILIIGGIILAVLNIFNIRERKYEIGVLAAIGMKKWKIAVQYTTELLLVTFIAVFIGTGIGAAGSVPITNALLEKQVENQSKGMYKVLIVEDDPMVSMINEQYVRRNKKFFVAGVCRDGKNALEFLDIHDIDLIILDVFMPHQDGFETLRQIRKKQMSVDVIMVTAANDRESLEEALHLGIVDYLVKPFTFERFCMALDKFIAQRNALNELGTLNQKSIDFIIDSARKKSEDMHPKGIQEKTLHLILKYMKENGHMWMSGENIAEEVGLTGVTVRRYLNYLTEVGTVVGEINYETGGRPCMLYKVVE